MGVMPGGAAGRIHSTAPDHSPTRPCRNASPNPRIQRPVTANHFTPTALNRRDCRFAGAQIRHVPGHMYSGNASMWLWTWREGAHHSQAERSRMPLSGESEIGKSSRLRASMVPIDRVLVGRGPTVVSRGGASAILPAQSYQPPCHRCCTRRRFADWKLRGRADGPVVTASDGKRVTGHQGGRSAAWGQGRFRTQAQQWVTVAVRGAMAVRGVRCLNLPHPRHPRPPSKPRRLPLPLPRSHRACPLAH